MKGMRYDLPIMISQIPLKRIPDTSKFEGSFEQVLLFGSRHLVKGCDSHEFISIHV